jgi:hypothetical protein
MLEWVCPKCGRDVDPGLTQCPFCGYQEARPATQAPVAGEGSAVPTGGRRVVRVRRSSWDWSDVERGFRFGLGLVAALAVTYFVLYLIAYYGGYGEWADRLAHWLRMR